MAENNTLGLNKQFAIMVDVVDGNTITPTPFHDLVLRKATYESVVMSLSDKITGEVVHGGNPLEFTLQEYIEYNGERYMLVNPPTIVREGMASDSAKGMVKYSLEFYHPMYLLSNLPFADVAVQQNEVQYLSENKTFSWIGYLPDFVAKINKNLQGTIFCAHTNIVTSDLSEVLSFDNQTIAEALKTLYDTWKVPYVVEKVEQGSADYANGKRFRIVVGVPSNEIYEHEGDTEPFVFKFGQGLGLKNNSRTPRNNKIVTRLAGYGGENNIPYGYPQIPWYGSEDWEYTDYENSATIVKVNGKITNNPAPNAYPLYRGIYNGQSVKLIKHPFTRNTLMPNIYCQTLFNKVSPFAIRELPNGAIVANQDYNPNITLVDYIDAKSDGNTTYPNPIVDSMPTYEAHQFEKIKPELGDKSIKGVQPITDDGENASGWIDTLKEDSDEYEQGYFKLTLPPLGFDLYACASITEQMQINMRSGACIGCTFEVQVDWDAYKSVFFDAEGNFRVPSGNGRSNFPNSTNESITITVKKDIDTFGTIMPNRFQYPRGEEKDNNDNVTYSGDKFVILGISLPQDYVTSAQDRLDAEMKSYLLEQNQSYFDYPLKFDEYFLATHPTILEQIHPNTIIHFDFNGEVKTLFVKQVNIKYGDKPLPQYDITLTDEIEVTLNALGKMESNVDRLGSLVNALQQNVGNDVWAELGKKLSKTSNDVAKGFISFLKGLQVGAQFVSGILGEGGVFRVNEDGKTYLETDVLYARTKAIFDNVEIRQATHTSGNRIVSNAGIKCTRVEELKTNDVVTAYRCYFRASDGDNAITNNFVVGDLANCHETTIDDNSDLNQHFYWRKVENVSSVVDENGEMYIDLSNKSNESGNEYAPYSDAPQAQDSIIQLGNLTDTSRQGAIVEYVNGNNTPSYRIYKGINGFSLNGKEQVALGYNSSTGKAFLNVRGDFRFGNSDDTGSYIKYDSGTGELVISSNVKFQSGNDTPQSFSTYAQSVQNSLSDLQGQIDGEIDTWFYSGTPALNNAPASSWTSEVLKERHIGDLYYDIGENSATAGRAYRFIRSGNEGNYTYSWQTIEDTAITEALRIANAAQTTANNKRRVFIGGMVTNNGTTTYVLPTTPYDKGDLWINAYYSNNGVLIYNNDILVCNTSKGENASFSVNDWGLASKYTDDTKFNTYISAILGNNVSGLDSNTQAVANYIKAIKTAMVDGSTDIVGGLILTSLIALRGTDSVWAGISGQYDEREENNGGAKGHGIAAWYGGKMHDLEVQTEQTAYNALTENEKKSYFAKSLLRFDGSGYLASGNITWDKTGKVTIRNIYSDASGSQVLVDGLLNDVIKFNQAFLFSMSNGNILKILPQYSFDSINADAISIKNKPVATEKWVGDNYISIAFFERLFTMHGDGSALVHPNDMDSIIASIEAMFGFWTEQYISSLGHNPNSGSGGSSSGGIDLVAMWSALNGNTNEQINASHLTNALANYVTSSALESALADYLTSADLDGYATVSALNTLATALSNLASVARSGNYNDLSNKPTIPTIPTNVSEFTNDAGYLKQQDISGKADKSEMSVTTGTGTNADKTTIQLKSGTSATVLTQHQSLANYVDKTSAQSITGKKAFKEISFVEYGVQSGANPNAARMFNSAEGWGGSAYLQLGGSNSGGNAENAIGFYILNRQWTKNLLSLTNAGNFNISGTISEGGTQLSQKYLGINATASKATQLANSRTLWGQSFNGTADVSGNMSGVGSLAMDGVLSGARGEFKEWNQLVDYDSLTIPNTSLANHTTINDTTITIDFNGVAIYNWFINIAQQLTIGHKIISICKASSTGTNWNETYFGFNGADNDFAATNILQTFAKIYVATNDYTTITMYGNDAHSAIRVFSDVMTCDLTAMFGAGLEPTTANEFARRLGYASIDDVPYFPYTATPTTLNNAVNFGGDLMVQGNKVILANGLVLNYNKSTNTLTFENTDGEPCNIVATGGVTALG